MDTMFREFFHKEIIDFKNLSADTLIIFDTNTLLNIYRYSNDTRKKLIEVMEEIKENIWIPNQVMLEFSLNRQEILAKLIKEKDDIPNETSQKYLSFYRGIEAFVNDIKIKSIDASSMKEELLANFKISLDKLEKEFSDQVHSILSIVDLTEDLAIEFKDLFTNRIGVPYDQKKLDEISTSAIERFKLKIPPAYKDSGKSEVVSYNGVTYEKKYGDLIIWNQILDKAIDENIKKVVFVTDDNKPDWWFKVQGKTIGPRAELKNELLRVSGADLHMFNSNSFLKQFTQNQSNLIVEEAELNNSMYENNVNEDYFEFKHSYNESEIISSIKQLNVEIKNYRSLIKKLRHEINKINERNLSFKNDIEKIENKSIASDIEAIIKVDEISKVELNEKIIEIQNLMEMAFQEHYYLTNELERNS
ncbi:PIN-like domain-containing protein (plasmid) [Exiguobacterium acetylicum]|uniref:PIN-like domain-containing protein n=1 Tax=Exiguobacterium acetylicum TaxID=41170 RepID=UPI003977954D